jgi:hypothetical protein
MFWWFFLVACVCGYVLVLVFAAAAVAFCLYAASRIMTTIEGQSKTDYNAV